MPSDALNRALAEQDRPSEQRGLPALERLIKIAYADHGGAVRIRRFLLGLYNGSDFPFDLTDLRCLDRENQQAVLDVLVMEMDWLRLEIHQRIPGVTGVIAKWAEEALAEAADGESVPRA